MRNTKNQKPGAVVEVREPGMLLDMMSLSLPPLHFLRELAVNAAEAGARVMRVMPDLFHTGTDPDDKSIPIRLLLEDDGAGMDLNGCLNLLTCGKEKVQGLDANFGWGGRLATLPENPAGVLFMVFGATAEALGFPEGAAMLIRRFSPSGRYKQPFYAAVQFKFRGDGGDAEFGCIVPVKQVFPEYLTDHKGKPRKKGTVIVLHGRTPDESTFHTHCRHAHTVVKHLNGRFALPPLAGGTNERLTATTWEFHKHSHPDQWPRTWQEALKTWTTPEEKTARHGMFRPARGLFSTLSEARDTKKGCKKLHYEKVSVGPGLLAHFFMVKPEYRDDGWWGTGLASGGKQFGLVWKGEVYNSSDGFQSLAQCGISSGALQERVWLFLEVLPVHNPDIVNNAERTRLLIAKDRDLPLREWRDLIADNLPQFIVDALEVAYGGSDFNEVSEKVMDELATQFGAFKRARRRASPTKKGAARTPPKNPGTPHSDGPVGNPPSRGRYTPPAAKWDSHTDTDVAVMKSGSTLTFYRKSPLVANLFAPLLLEYGDLPSSKIAEVENAVCAAIVTIVAGCYYGSRQRASEGCVIDENRILEWLWVPLVNTPLVEQEIKRKLHPLLTKGILKRPPKAA